MVSCFCVQFKANLNYYRSHNNKVSPNFSMTLTMSNKLFYTWIYWETTSLIALFFSIFILHHLSIVFTLTKITDCCIYFNLPDIIIKLSSFCYDNIIWNNYFDQHLLSPSLSAALMNLVLSFFQQLFNTSSVLTPFHISILLSILFEINKFFGMQGATSGFSFLKAGLSL
jgi:hypothetical protein